MIHRLNTYLTLALLLCFSIITEAKDKIPFRLEGNLLLIKATLNGQTGNFLLDTGAPDLGHVRVKVGHVALLEALCRGGFTHNQPDRRCAAAFRPSKPFGRGGYG